jgi:hypothetical protein
MGVWAMLVAQPLSRGLSSGRLDVPPNLERSIGGERGRCSTRAGGRAKPWHGCRELVIMASAVVMAGGVRLKFVKENLTFTGEGSPMANLMLSVMGAFAAFERASPLAFATTDDELIRHSTFLCTPSALPCGAGG